MSQSPKQGIQSLNEEVIKSGPDGTAAIVNGEGVPVVVTGPVGKGRVALNGMLPGAVGARDDSSDRNLQSLELGFWLKTTVITKPVRMQRLPITMNRLIFSPSQTTANSEANTGFKKNGMDV